MMQTTEYLSDEALLALIDASEEQGLLHAPRDVKPAVLTAAQQSAPRKRPSRRLQFAAYCLRVGLAAAASLALVFGGSGLTQSVADRLTEQSEAVAFTQTLSQYTDRLEEGYENINQQLSQWINSFGGNEQ